MDKNDFSADVDFSALVSGLMAEALASMGMIDHPSMKGVKKDLKHTQAVINTLSMLKEKTSGNLTSKESEFLEEVLHQLRIGYVASLKDEKPRVSGEKRTDGAT